MVLSRAAGVKTQASWEKDTQGQKIYKQKKTISENFAKATQLQNNIFSYNYEEY